MAMLYDSLLSLGLAFVFTLLVVIASGGAAVGAGSSWLPVGLLALLFAFFGWCWTHGGQTLGMRAWRLRLLRRDGKPLAWSDAAKRYSVSWLVLLPAGLGLWWALLDREGLSLQDRLSGTQLTLLPKT